MKKKTEIAKRDGFSLEKYLREMVKIPKPVSLEEVRDESLSFLLRIYEEKLAPAEFRDALVFCAALEKFGKDMVSEMSEEVRIFVREEIKLLMSFSKDLKICIGVAKVNSKKLRGVCGVLARMLCAYLNKRNIVATPQRRGRHWIVLTEKFGEIDPVFEILEPYIFQNTDKRN